MRVGWFALYLIITGSWFIHRKPIYSCTVVSSPWVQTSAESDQHLIKFILIAGLCESVGIGQRLVFAQYHVAEWDIGACDSVRIGQRLVLHNIRLLSRIWGHATVLG